MMQKIVSPVIRNECIIRLYAVLFKVLYDELMCIFEFLIHNSIGCIFWAENSGTEY